MRSAILVASLTILVTMQVASISAHTLRGREIRSGFWWGCPIDYAEGLIGLRLTDGVTPEQLYPVLQALGIEVVEEFDKNGIGLLESRSAANLFVVIDELGALPLVDWVQPDQVSRLDGIYPNDDQFWRQWGLDNWGQSGGTDGWDIDGPEAWETTVGSSSILVGVLDSGIAMQYDALSHPDLDDAARFHPGTDWVEDGFGVMDEFGHGTHVIGILAAETNNDEGVAGTCWNCQILVDQVFDKYGGGDTWGFYKGVEHCVDEGCRIINFSGSTDQADYFQEWAVQYALDHNVLVVSSAGNTGTNTVRYPAHYADTYENVVAVGAIDHNGQRATYSSYGWGLTLCAPGGSGSGGLGDVYSTTPNYPFRLEGGTTTRTYGYMAGVSMAVPHVSGVAALCLSVNSSFTPGQLRQILEYTCDDMGVAGYDEFTGYGCVNAKKALDEANALPLRYFSTIDGDRHETVQWGTSQNGWEMFYLWRSDTPKGPWDLVDSIPEQPSLYDYSHDDWHVRYSMSYYWALSSRADPEMTEPISGHPYGLPEPTYPPTPTDLVARDYPGDTGGSIILSWTVPAQMEGEPQPPLEFHVYRGEVSGQHQFLLETEEISCVDSTVTTGRTYYYVVRSCRSEIHSSASNEAQGRAVAEKIGWKYLGAEY